MKEFRNLTPDNFTSRNINLGFIGENIKINTDFSLEKFPFKNSYPWHLTINLKVKKFFSNSKNKDFIKNLVEKKLHKLINAHCRFKQISKVELLGDICYHWYIECPNIDYSNSKAIIDEIKQFCHVKFDINEDPKWDNMKLYFN